MNRKTKETWIWLICLITACMISINSFAGKLSASSIATNKKGCDSYGFPFDDAVNLSNQLIEALKGNQKEIISSLMHYPLKVNYSTNKNVSKTLIVNNKAELLVYYDFIFNKATRDYIINSNPKNIFCNYQGAAFANGIVWISSNVYAINRLKKGGTL